jgi:pimeloyl-ACP methyl ester carboxylesterase
MSAVVIDGGIVHYESLGRGRPLVFVHGWLGSWRYWMATMGELSDTYRTYALDLWGFGDSDKSQPRYTLAHYVTLLRSFLDELGIQRTPIVGHSLGAAVALRLALTDAERIDRMALISLPFSEQDVNGKALASGKSTLGAGLFGAPVEYGPVLSELDKTDRQAIDMSVSSMSGVDVGSHLDSLRTPSLIVCGSKDPIVTPPRDEFFATPAQLLPDGSPSAVRAILMAGLRHFPMLEEASQFNRLLRDFLALDVSVPATLHALELKEEWRRRMH